MGRGKLTTPATEAVLEAFPGASVVRTSEVCSLWAGYGSIYRVQLSSGGSVVVKHITPPANSVSISNVRKVRSYKVEGYFYAHLAPASVSARLPRVFSIVSHPNSFCFVLEDLATEFPKSFHSLSGTTLQTALAWLAHFHATFWNYDQGGVAETGGYWYLETRQEELDAMANDPLSKKLKKHAETIDKHTRDARFETLMHGDAKSANILWADPSTCAWVDFQYVGHGLGARDVAYLLCSSASRSEVGAAADTNLRHYFETFLAVLADQGKNSHGYTFEQFQAHFDWCLLDYVRFMAGWGYWGNYDWAISRTEALLDTLW
ncbi:hypothetical protein LEN26_011386 [Aphanomyces euteiches]|nr:hypothetical protein AeMF1_019912 [Aphanomyces euteiches]KAH9119882.1 hypothetical protein LEN26_011386 [Aphanomyces euteiches]KAH9184686.1 hypothetical protein AeNC1_013337 [Aphanomyces euteiches]